MANRYAKHRNRFLYQVDNEQKQYRKLSRGDRRDILKKYIETPLTQKNLAEEYNVTQTWISIIVCKGIKWLDGDSSHDEFFNDQ